MTVGLDFGHTNRCARVLPDVTGLDKPFDYSIPDELADQVSIGTMVRVELHGRRIGGWVVGLPETPGIPFEELKPLAKIRGHGPSADIIELAEWASVRWAARRVRPFLVNASPINAVRSLPSVHRRATAPAPTSPATKRLLASGGGVLRLPPRSDVLPSVLSAVGLGPTLVVVPTNHDAMLLASRLRRTGTTVAYVPDDWGAAAAGVDVVIGSRSAAWMPCAGLAAAIVVDEHDESLQQGERSPTWHARDVVAERCRRAGVPAVFISPAPTLVAVEELAGRIGVVHPPRERERLHWPKVEVVDRSDEDPWKKSLVTSALIERLRDPLQRVACVSNITGRARVLACRTCRELTRCETCDAAVGLADEGHLVCRRCETERPAVCQACGAGKFANLRPGVTRLREELEAAANREVAAVTGADAGPLPRAGIYVGTEALLHRLDRADVVAFLEFDSEMLAPRFRASEQALALIIRAGRLAPEVMIQTFNADHDVVRAAKHADPDIVLDAERERRSMLNLPPYGALASVSGAFSSEVIDQLDRTEVQVGQTADDRYLVRAVDWVTLGRALNATQRPPGARVKIEVDPARV